MPNACALRLASYAFSRSPGRRPAAVACANCGSRVWPGRLWQAIPISNGSGPCGDRGRLHCPAHVRLVMPRSDGGAEIVLDDKIFIFVVETPEAVVKALDNG